MITFHHYHGSGFWPKNPYTRRALNYIGRLGIKYIFQQRTVQKISEDNHYKYARELAIQYRNSTLFTTTDHKNKIKCMSLVVLFQL